MRTKKKGSGPSLGENGGGSSENEEGKDSELSEHSQDEGSQTSDAPAGAGPSLIGSLGLQELPGKAKMIQEMLKSVPSNASGKNYQFSSAKRQEVIDFIGETMTALFEINIAHGVLKDKLIGAMEAEKQAKEEKAAIEKKMFGVAEAQRRGPWEGGVESSVQACRNDFYLAQAVMQVA